MLRRRLIPVLIAVPLALAGCSGNGNDASPAPAPSNAAESAEQSLQPGQEVDANQFFEKTQKAMIDAKTYAMTMRMEGSGETMTMTGVGDISDAARPKADMKMSAPGSSTPMHMIIDGENVFMQMPGVAPEGKFVQMPMSVLSQAGGQDMTKLMNPAENLKLTQDAVDKVVFQGVEDVGGEKLRHYQITMDPAKLRQGLMTEAPTGASSGPEEPLPYDVWVDDADRMRKMTMNVEGTTMTMEAKDYGKPVTITAPPSASITQMPGLSGGGSTVPASPAPTASPVPSTTN